MSVKPFFYIGRSAKTSYEIGEKEERRIWIVATTTTSALLVVYYYYHGLHVVRGDWLLIANSRPL